MPAPKLCQLAKAPAYPYALLMLCSQAVGMSLCPESPVWLMWRGRRHLAAASWRKLHGADLAPDVRAQLEGADAEEPLLHQEVGGGAAWIGDMHEEGADMKMRAT